MVNSTATEVFFVPFSSLTTLPITQAESISPQVVDVWLLDLSSITHQDGERFSSFLSQDEMDRSKLFKKNPHHFIATRALLRHALARYTRIAPEALIFSRGLQGKPFLTNSSLPIFFNLSHSHNMAALAITTLGELGVDIESKRQRNVLKIADRYFHEDEKAQIARCDPASREELFYRLWTLKEAFFKALGTGISHGLHKARFQLQDNNITAQFADDLSIETNQWQFNQAVITADTVAAFAVNSTTPLEIHWFDAKLLLT